MPKRKGILTALYLSRSLGLSRQSLQVRAGRERLTQRLRSLLALGLINEMAPATYELTNEGESRTFDALFGRWPKGVPI